ncbi:FMN-dependent NADH-azoreductase [Marinobacter sp. F4206]|uniref:FMN-dependent NADH-azoreductase n=1 Tax=Marinobacter sp. F4206 TaxID=2861777 RepID=UPI001C5E5ADF|nr:NAD(P)H-dependent oxidoreductase [Marinobacter sp. F4206]MBW4933160.1 NAD(P)H-dependent oxidoreductase [Marinobacter sp. F4206]
MANVLVINASARSGGSISRELTHTFRETWLSSRPEDNVVDRDVGLNPPPIISEEWIAACFTQPEERSQDQHAILEMSDTLISELEAADLVVIGTPMYNYGMPAALKAWVDQVVRINKTFSFDLDRGDWPLEPIFSGKTLVVFTSKGEFGFSPGNIREHMNFLDGHVGAVSHYLGVANRYFVHSEYQEFKDSRHEASKTAAFEEAAGLARKLSSGL